jgi:hypothetical protein
MAIRGMLKLIGKGKNAYYEMIKWLCRNHLIDFPYTFIYNI